MMAMTIDGYVNGDGSYMIAPINMNKGVCGYGALSQYQYLYMPDIAAATASPTDYFKYGVCVDECPSGSTPTVTCQPDKVTYCTDNSPAYATVELLNYCIPSGESIANA